MDNYLRWNAVNWFTVAIMGASMFALYGFLGQLFRTAIGKGPTTSSSANSGGGGSW
jgi:hypothetical protein